MEVATSTATKNFEVEDDERYESEIIQPQEDVRLYNENFALVGASGASVDDKWQMAKQ